jgi:hypothetical protein
MSNRYVELRQTDGEVPTVTLARNYFDVGGIVRVGEPGRLSLFGASITGDDERPGDRLILPDNGVLIDLGPSPIAYTAHRMRRVNVLYGIRDISFVRREGLDALTATQDVPLGFQLGTQLGRALTLLGSDQDDVFAAGDLYLGAASGIATFRLQAQGEGRRGVGSSQWDGVLTTGRATQYLKFSPWHLNQVVLEWAGVYRPRIPFQLLLGTPESGVRGYEKSGLAGGQRLVAKVEERFVLGRLFDLADTGIAFFADAGRVWAGDVPFGTTTGLKSSVGFSILASVPPRSARMWRMDIAFPLSKGANTGFTIGFTNADRTQFVFREARDVAESRELTVPSSIFAWP